MKRARGNENWNTWNHVPMRSVMAFLGRDEDTFAALRFVCVALHGLVFPEKFSFEFINEKSIDVRYDNMWNCPFLKCVTHVELCFTTDGNLQCFTGLQLLSTFSAKITSLRSLSLSAHLRHVDLSYAKLSSLDGISELMSLESLYLKHSKNENNGIQYDMSLLALSLKVLDLHNADLSNAHALSKLLNLTHVNMFGQNVNDISFLSTLPNLLHMVIGSGWTPSCWVDQFGKKIFLDDVFLLPGFHSLRLLELDEYFPERRREWSNKHGAFSSLGILFFFGFFRFLRRDDCGPERGSSQVELFHRQPFKRRDDAI